MDVCECVCVCVEVELGGGKVVKLVTVGSELRIMLRGTVYKRRGNLFTTILCFIYLRRDDPNLRVNAFS